MDINKLISSKENPLVTIARLTNPRQIVRGMGFVYKKLSRKVKVIVSCRHTFMNLPFEEFNFFNGGNMSLNVVSPPFYHENKAHDIMFCVVHDPEKSRTEEFNSFPKSSELYDNQLLYNVRSIYHPGYVVYPFEIRLHKIWNTKALWAFKAYDPKAIPFESTDGISRAKYMDDGYVIYQSIGMLGERGCSGSPIFDDNLNLYGMSVACNQSGNISIYVPIHEINVLYKKIEGEIERKYGI